MVAVGSRGVVTNINADNMLSVRKSEATNRATNVCCSGITIIEGIAIESYMN